MTPATALGPASGDRGGGAAGGGGVSGALASPANINCTLATANINCTLATVSQGGASSNGSVSLLLFLSFFPCGHEQGLRFWVSDLGFG
jgi:hypothetical protein